MGDPANIHSIFLMFKVLIWKKNLNYRERERHVLSQPPQSLSGKKAGPLLPAPQTSALCSASSMLSFRLLSAEAAS